MFMVTKQSQMPISVVESINDARLHFYLCSLMTGHQPLFNSSPWFPFVYKFSFTFYSSYFLSFFPS